MKFTLFPRFLKELRLSAVSISETMTEIEKFLDKCNISHEKKTRARVIIEEVFLQWQDAGMGNSCCTVEIRSWLKSVSVALKCKAEEIKIKSGIFSAEASGDFSQYSLLQMMECQLNTQYRNGTNIVAFEIRKKSINDLLKIGIGIFAGVLFSLFISSFAPEYSKPYLTYVAEPLSQKFLKVIASIAVALVFVKILCSIANTESLKKLRLLGILLFRQFFLVIFITVVISITVGLLFFKIPIGAKGSGNFGMIFKFFYGIIPENFLEPFISCNTPQVVFLAFCLGGIILYYKEIMGPLINILTLCDSALQRLIELVCILLPVFVGLQVSKLMLSSSASNFYSLFSQTTLFLIIMIMIYIFLFLYLKLFCHVSPFGFYKKLLPVAMIGYATASSTVAYPKNLDCCENRLGIDRNFLNLGLPLATVFCKMGSSIKFSIGALWMIYMTSSSFSLESVIMLAVVALIFSFVSPPVAGNIIAIQVLILDYFSVPMDYIGLLAIFETITDYLHTPLNIFGAQVQLFSIAEKMNLVKPPELLETKPQYAAE